MGLGVVGSAAYGHFKRTGRELRLYDPNRDLGSRAEINDADIVFVCVPTPYSPERGFDDTILHQALGILQEPKVVVIKSTVLPGTTEACQARYPQHAFLFNPEFLRQDFAQQDFSRPDRQLVGYTAQSRHAAELILELLPDAPFTQTMIARQAELVKYATNAFLALKVTFANEIFDLACALDIEYSVVRDAVAADERIGPSHLAVLDGGYRGYGGKCLPKDTKALIQLGERLGVPLGLMRTADRINAAFAPPGDMPLVVRSLSNGTKRTAAPRQAA
jgi:UDPglucose 6-dehydrogenase